MPIALLVLGGAIIASAIKGTEHDLGALLAKDFTGKGSFLVWLAAIGGLGVLGSINALREPSRYLIALVIVAMLFSDKGFFSQLFSTMQQGVTPDKGKDFPQGSSSSSSSGSGGGSGGGSSGGMGGTIGTVAKLAVLVA